MITQYKNLGSEMKNAQKIIFSTVCFQYSIKVVVLYFWDFKLKNEFHFGLRDYNNIIFKKIGR